MGVASKEGGGGERAPLIFTHDTAYVFSRSTRFVKTSLLSPTIVFLCCAG